MSAKPELPESRLSAHMLSDTSGKSAIATRNSKTSKAETRERSIEPPADEASGLVQMTFASEGMLRFGSIKDSIRQSKLNQNL